MPRGKLTVGAMALLFITAVVASEISIWRECRSDHSWLYCMRVLHR